MAITAELQEISSRGGTGSIAKGVHREVIQGKENGATPYELSPEESGALCVAGALTGQVWRLPTPAVGMWFEFFNTIANTSLEMKVTTRDTATQFLLGSVIQASETLTQSMDVFTADGTSNHVDISQNGTTTGGEVGNYFSVTAISATQWLIRGVLQNSANDATDPFTDGT